MTAPRLARAGRSRFIIAIGILILIVGFVALFNSSQQQLDESNLLRLRCEQQHDALNSQLQAIVDHKFRLEKSLENERKEYLEIKESFELKAEEDKNQYAKLTLDANIKLEASIQQLKILQSKHNDLIENCAKNKNLQSEEINGLENKLNLLQNQIKLGQTNKDKEIEEWKVKYENLTHEKDRLEIILKATKSSNKCARCEILLKEYKENCDYQPPEIINENLPDNNYQSQNHNHRFTQEDPPPAAAAIGQQELKSNIIQKSFNEQKLVSKDLYKIPINFTNKTQTQLSNNLVNGNLKNINNKSAININNDKKIPHNNILGAIINSVENFQIAPKPLLSSNDQNNGDGFQQPPPLNPPLKYSSSTKASSAYKSHDEFNKRDLPIASVASPSSAKYQISKSLNNNNSSSSTTSTTPATNENLGRINRLLKPKQLPKGVAPVPEAENFDVLIKNDEINRSDIPQNNLEVNAIGGGAAGVNTGISTKLNAGNNRYANVVNEFSNHGGGGGGNGGGVDNIINNEKKDDEDNVAREIKDNDFNNGIDEKLEEKDQLQAVLDNLNNAAEDDTNNFFDSKLMEQNKKENDMDDDAGPPIHNNKHKNNNGILDDDIGGGDDNKLINEVVGDQGKEQAFPDGMHLEEANEEDDDDYSIPGARKQEGAAIRN